PHWPYIAPAPYNAMYGPEHIVPVVRSPAEYDAAHPVMKAFMTTPVGQAFSRDEVRDKVIPAYMGLIKQCDDQMGVLLDWMEATGRMADTMIVLTSDHGDYLGDHWMGEKTFFHDAAVKVPLIIYDPDANQTRGTVCDELVMAIDLAPTFVEAAGGVVASNILEGRSLLPLLHGGEWEREAVICEYDYSATPLPARLGVDLKDAQLFMVADKRWKLIHCEGGFAPILFDLLNDPDELTSLGTDPAHAAIVDQMYDKLHRWARRTSQRFTRTEDETRRLATTLRRQGVILGAYDETDLPAELSVAYRGRKAPVRRK
ncbi:MAG: sulfatase-like hydrolase/transferase, partial [Pseudooceanicola sp.]|nr:sulfatase-like hydrolase/transferase [Pseudooceanicola sp.]